TEKKPESRKPPIEYRIFSVIAYATAGAFLHKTIGSAFYSFYALLKIISGQGFEVLNDATRDVALAPYTQGYFPFSWTSMLSLVFILLIGFIFRNLAIYVVAQFVLPVALPADREKARKRFEMFINGEHGAATFVKEGKLIERHKEIESTKPGVVLVDLSSAVVLAQHEQTESWNLADHEDDLGGREYSKVIDGVQNLMILRQSRRTLVPSTNNFLARSGGTGRQTFTSKESKKSTPFVETKGPGLVFTEKGQKIFNVLDLRRQTRSKDNVEAYTRNGIKITTRISVSFSLSDEPEIIPVGYVDLPGGTELRWLSLEETDTSLTIKQSFPLEPPDMAELGEYTRDKSGDYTPPEYTRTSVSSPYKFYERRVFDAAFSRARSIKTGEFIPWYDAPLEIAVDIFRKELLSIPYDDLYPALDVQRIATARSNGKKDAAEPRGAAIKELKEAFARKVKIKGIVLFQWLERRDRLNFRHGEVVRTDLVSRHPVISLSRHRFNSLRSVGVVVKSASIGDLQPVNPDIKKELLKRWMAKWQKEVDYINAEYDLEAVRIRNRARARIQQEMTYLLSSIFQGSHTDEALALRVFQALESAATNPAANSDISPKEIVTMLDSLHKWLLIERKDALGKGPDLQENKK
ncbi:MAG: hypothetical protein AB1798_19275, partial [Spirochaetota bacterium]